MMLVFKKCIICLNKIVYTSATKINNEVDSWYRPRNIPMSNVHLFKRVTEPLLSVKTSVAEIVKKNACLKGGFPGKRNAGSIHTGRYVFFNKTIIFF